MAMTRVLMKTLLGDMTLELDIEKAPETVANFVAYANAGHYDGTIFHRVIDGFMIQGGGFEPGMTQRATRDAIKNEADNQLKNKTGTIAMARTPDPHSATAQLLLDVCSAPALLEHGGLVRVATLSASLALERGELDAQRRVEGRAVSSISIRPFATSTAPTSPTSTTAGSGSRSTGTPSTTARTTTRPGYRSCWRSRKRSQGSRPRRAARSSS